MDKEKVLQALEHCDLCSDMPNCPGCAYLREPDCMEHLKRDIIALLKAQEPVEPILDIRHGKSMWRCGSCSTALQPNQIHTKFCFNCGRAVKWDG